MGDNKRWSAADFAALLWAALHLYTSVHAFLYGLYQTYTSRTWVLLSVWLLGQLALDGWLCAGRPGLLRFAKWYWGISTALHGGVLAIGLLDCSIPDLAAVVFVIALFLTPLHQLTAFSWLLLHGQAGLKGSALGHAQCCAGLAFCLIHFIYFARLHRRAKQRGAAAYGFVEPGAGTVE